MATKDDCLPFKGKQNVFVDTVFKDQFKNLNLNQNQKCVYKSLRSKSVTIDDKKVQNYDFTTDNVSQTKNYSNSWNKCSKDLPSNFLNLNREDNEKDEFKGKAKSANNSTLSLHIAAYENSIEACKDSDDCEKEIETLSMAKKWGNSKHFIDSTAIIQNPFEFPRQQDDKANRPELMQFSASQRLLNPNQIDANNQIRPPPICSTIYPTSTSTTMAHGFSPSFSGDLKLVKSEDGYVNGIKFEAKPGAKAYRNHIRITAVLPDGRERCLTERKSKRDEKKDLPISAHELRVNNLILSDAYDHTHGFGVEGMERVYDNRAMMYTPVSIPCNTIEIPVEKLIHAKGYVTGQKVIVDIRNNDMGFLDLNDRKFFGVTTSTGQEDHELRSFYELLVVQGSLDLKECVAVGSELYISCDQRHQIMYTRGISFINGFKKNARIVQDNGKAVVKLVVDPVDSAFYAQQRLADSFHDVTNGDYSNPRAIEHFFSLYKNVRVFLSFNKSKILPVHGLSKQKLEDIRFDKDGIPTSVMEHFRNEYGFSSRAGEMPALEVRFMNGQHGFYPLDCLEILKCQKVPMFKYTLVSPTLHDDILKRNAVRAPQRFNKTLTCFSYVERSHNIFQNFGVSFSSCQMIRLGIRAKPQILTGTGTVNPDVKARFNLRGHKYVDPSRCKKWMVLNGSNHNIQELIGRLLNEARTRGLALASPQILSFNSADLSKENWTQIFGDLLEHGYEYVLLIDSKKSRQAQTHHMFKCCELIFGVQTQHVHLETLMKYPCHENIVHKMNMKLDGINYHVVLEPSNINKLFYDDKIFIVGYDVAHPPPSGKSDDAEPSVVGVSYNACRQYQSFNGNYFFQPSQQEAVEPELLKKAIMDGLKMRTKQRPNSGKPELVFVFRDGLSEGQILMAKLEELEAIKEGFQEYYGHQAEKLPPFVMVLATKRHNRRFYSSNHENVLPGTVVSQGIARLGATEFYMQSAFPIQGTAKLTDYEVIENEAKLSVNDIQAFTHGMCYTHQIVSSAVSLPEPVYLAHELAKRGRNNLICYSDVSVVPRNADGIDYLKLNQKFTYLDNDLIHRRFTA